MIHSFCFADEGARKEGVNGVGFTVDEDGSCTGPVISPLDSSSWRVVHLVRKAFMGDYW